MYKHLLKYTNISYLALSQDHTLLPSLLESCIDPRSALQLLRLLGCVTAVCVEDWLLDGLSLPHTSPPLVTTSKPLIVASNTSIGNTSSIASSSSVQDINDLDVSGTVLGQLDTPVITPTSDFIIVPKNIASDAGSAVSSTAHIWGRDDILGSLPWLRWRGVALTPVCEDLSSQSQSQSNVSISSDVFKLSHSKHQDITSNPGADDMMEREREMKGDAKKGATMSSKLSFAQTEHTTQYRDEELEKEVDVALSRRIGKPGLKAAPKGTAFAARDAPCVLRRKVIPRSGPNRTQVITDRLAPRGDGHSGGKSDDHNSLKDGLALMLAANREALLEKRTYSMINRKPSLRNQMLARKEHSSPQESDSGEGNVLRIRRNYTGETVAGNGQIRNGNGKTSADHRPLLQPLRKSLFQVSGPGLEFNPNDFVTSSTAVISGVSKKSDLRAVLGPGRIRGDWISALIAGGPPPGVKKRVDSGTKPASTPLPCTVTATSSSFKKKSSRDHNEDDFTAIEDGNELNSSSARSINDPLSISTTHSKAYLERKPSLAFNAFRFPEKGRMKLSGSGSSGSSGINPLKRSSTGFGKPTRQRDGEKSGEKNTDLILALTVKKKRALDDVRANFPAPSFQTSLSGTVAGAGTGTVAGTGVGTGTGTGTGSSGQAVKDLPLNSFIPWRSGNPENNGGTKRIRHNPDNVNLTPISATHGTLPGLCPPLSSLPAITVSKTGNRFPPTFKVNPRPTPTPSQTSVPPFAMNQQITDHEHLGWDDNNDRMEVEEPYTEGSGIPGYSLIQSDGMHSAMPLIDHEDLVDHSSHSPEESSKTISPLHTQSSKEEGKTLTRRVGIPTARSMNSNSVGGVIVSGTLQRAKPGPKPRLQFTSDGDSNTVRKEMI